MRHSTDAPPRRVVIVGGGFAGSGLPRDLAAVSGGAP